MVGKCARVLVSHTGLNIIVSTLLDDGWRLTTKGASANTVAELGKKCRYHVLIVPVAQYCPK